MDTKHALSVTEFAAAHGISRQMVYRLWRHGRGPRYMQVGGRRLISVEAAAEWRRELERATVQHEAA